MPVSTLAETTTFDISGMMSGFASSALTGISDTVTALIPVITTVVLVSFAIHMFKKYVK